MSAAPLLLVAAGGMLVSILVGRAAERFWLTATLVGATAALVAAGRVLAGGAEWEWRSGFLLGGEALHLRLDAVSALFLVLLCVVGGAGAVYGRGYWTERAHPRSARLRPCLVERFGDVPWAGARHGQWLAFSHRMGAVHRQRLFSRDAGAAKATRYGRRAGSTWRRRT